jgi:hypothetical protein
LAQPATGIHPVAAVSMSRSTSFLISSRALSVIRRDMSAAFWKPWPISLASIASPSRATVQVDTSSVSNAIAPEPSQLSRRSLIPWFRFLRMARSASPTCSQAWALTSIFEKSPVIGEINVSIRF